MFQLGSHVRDRVIAPDGDYVGVGDLRLESMAIARVDLDGSGVTEPQAPAAPEPLPELPGPPEDPEDPPGPPPTPGPKPPPTPPVFNVGRRIEAERFTGTGTAAPKVRRSANGTGRHALVRGGQSLAYRVRATAGGTFDLVLRVKPTGRAARVNVAVDGKVVVRGMRLAPAKGRLGWRVVVVPGVRLAAGAHDLRLAFSGPGAGTAVDWLSLRPAQATRATAPAPR